jgi:hypothetical protein
LEKDPDNCKCLFRIASAIWRLKDKNENQINEAFKFISKANQLMKTDESISSLYKEIKTEHDKINKISDSSKN